jgi:hypothetical protein
VLPPFARHDTGQLQSAVFRADKKWVRIPNMMRVIAAALLSIGLVDVAAGQSLGDVARKEAERKKAVKSTGKVYTNDTLKPAPQPSGAAADSSTQAAEPTASAPSTPEPAPSDTAKASGKGDESSWRKRMSEAREALARSETFAAALQNQLNSLATDFVNRDDPVQRSAIAANRDKVAAELDRVKKEIAAQTKAIAAIQEEARRAGVPAGWVR